MEKCPDVLNKLLGNKQNGNAFDQEFHDDLIKIFEAASACVPNKSVENEQIDLLEPQDNNDNYETKQMDRVDINSDSLLTNESCSDSENSENSEGSDDSEDDDLYGNNIEHQICFDSRLSTHGMRFASSSMGDRHNACVFAAYGQNWNEVVPQARKVTITKLFVRSHQNKIKTTTLCDVRIINLDFVICIDL